MRRARVGEEDIRRMGKQMCSQISKMREKYRMIRQRKHGNRWTG